MRVLLLGSSARAWTALSEPLLQEGYLIVRAQNESELKSALRDGGVVLALIDLGTSSLESISLLRSMRAEAPYLTVLALSERAAPGVLAEAISLGSVECVLPMTEPAELLRRIRTLVEDAFVSVETHGHLALWSPTTRSVYKSLARAARSNATALITGETGTGKEVAARTLHAVSPRRNKPLMAVNCAALSSELLESELFGHERGAFTGAARLRRGRFEEADGGTVLLDDISEIDIALQAKLLRILQEGTYERVGSNDTLRSTARVIATSNRDLEREVAKGRFRQDLYYRLDVLHIALSPLRDRKSEIPLFIELFSRKHGLRVTESAVERLVHHVWSGNVRELENLFERLAVLGPGKEIDLRHLPAHIREMNGRQGNEEDPKVSLSLPDLLLAAERDAILKAMRRSADNQVQAAKLLGIPRSTLQRRLLELGLTAPLEAARG